jgi:hypothetical protein
MLPLLLGMGDLGGSDSGMQGMLPLFLMMFMGGQ